TDSITLEGELQQLVRHSPTSPLRVGEVVIKTDQATGRSRLMVARATGFLEPASPTDVSARNAAGQYPLPVDGKIVTVAISALGEISFPIPPAGAPGGPSNV
ncbi:MAG: hypothetical protein ACRC1U_04860, partial [Vibrionaceae bacterium]